MQFINTLLTPNSYSRPGTPMQQVKGIVIHNTGKAGQPAEKVIEYFESLKNQTNSQKQIYASAHYIIDFSGSVYQCIPNDEIAYHCGSTQYAPIGNRLKGHSPSPNYHTLGIELCQLNKAGHFTGVTLQTCRELVRELIARYGLTANDVYTHNSITGKNCPSYFVSHPEEWDYFLKSL